MDDPVHSLRWRPGKGVCAAGGIRGRGLEVAAAGRYGFAAVGTHQQVIPLRDVVMLSGESFAITRAIMAELYPRRQLLFYEGGDPGAFREQARAQLEVDCGSRHDSSGARPVCSTSCWPTTASGNCARRTAGMKKVEMVGH